MVPAIYSVVVPDGSTTIEMPARHVFPVGLGISLVLARAAPVNFSSATLAPLTTTPIRPPHAGRPVRLGILFRLSPVGTAPTLPALLVPLTMMVMSAQNASLVLEATLCQPKRAAPAVVSNVQQARWTRTMMHPPPVCRVSQW